MSNIYTNLVASGMPAAPPGRRYSLAEAELRDQPSVAVKTAYAAADEVTRIAANTATVSGGNYTISVNATALGITYTTASILYNATAATIEAALDTASPATVVDGDITVSEEGSAGHSDGYCDYTCSGNLASTPVLITITDVDLTGGGTVGAVTRTTGGQAIRNATQALFELNVVTGTLQKSAAAPADWTRPSQEIYDPKRIGASTRTLLLVLAEAEDGTSDVRTTVEALYP